MRKKSLYLVLFETFFTTTFELIFPHKTGDFPKLRNCEAFEFGRLVIQAHRRSVIKVHAACSCSWLAGRRSTRLITNLNSKHQEIVKWTLLTLIMSPNSSHEIFSPFSKSRSRFLIPVFWLSWVD